MSRACYTGDLELLSKVVSKCVINRWTILSLTHTACALNHTHIVYWLLATYPLQFSPKNTISILMDHVAYYNNSVGWKLTFGRLPANYNCVATNYMLHNITHITHDIWRLNTMFILCIESEYSL
jgi:hypothetical protein